jgi:hypothetical protein
MKPEEFLEWYSQHREAIQKEMQYKGLVGALHYVYEKAREEKAEGEENEKNASLQNALNIARGLREKSVPNEKAAKEQGYWESWDFLEEEILNGMEQGGYFEARGDNLHCLHF